MKLGGKRRGLQDFCKVLTSQKINWEITVIMHSLWRVRSIVNFTSCLKPKVGGLLQQR